MGQRECEQLSQLAETASGPDSRRRSLLTLLTEPSDSCNSNVKHVNEREHRREQSLACKVVLVRTYARLLSTHDQIWVMFRHVGRSPEESTFAPSAYEVHTALQRRPGLVQRKRIAK